MLIHYKVMGNRYSSIYQHNTEANYQIHTYNSKNKNIQSQKNIRFKKFLFNTKKSNKVNLTPLKQKSWT